MVNKLENTERCAIICDLKDSKQIVDWTETFKKLQHTIEKLNKKFIKDIFIKFTPTIGDEFQGVLKSYQNLYEIYSFIESQIPFDFYCGVGIGEIEKPFKKNVGLRGSAFYQARDAITLCKKSHTDFIIISSEKQNFYDNSINLMMKLIRNLKKSWTPRQKEIIDYYKQHPDYTYEKIGEHFKVSKSSISKILISSDWQIVQECENLLTNFINNKSQLLMVDKIKSTNKG